MAIAKRFFRKTELQLVAHYGSDAFMWVWSRKEAVVKSFGRSIMSDIKKFDVLLKILSAGGVLWSRSVREHTKSPEGK